MKIIEVTAIAGSLHTLILPLMNGLRAADYDVIASCGASPGVSRVVEAGYRVEVVPQPRGSLRHGFAAYRAWVRLFRSEQPDMVHVHTPIAAFIARLAARRARVPLIVYTVHGFHFHDLMPWWKRLPFVALEWIAGRFTHVLFSQNDEDTRTAGRLHLCRGSIVETIGNGVDPDTFSPARPGEREEIRVAFGVTSDEPVIIMLGRFNRSKGYPELFRAMRRVRARLWVIGATSPGEDAGAIAAELAMVESDPDLASRITFLGFRRDVDRLMRAGDIFVLPSHREGMPRSIIEAMMSGLPVVATNIRGTREEVIDGETGILVPVGDDEALADALQRLVDDPGLRQAMGERGLARARAHFDEGAVISRQLELLEVARHRYLAAP